MARDLAARYANVCETLAQQETTPPDAMNSRRWLPSCAASRGTGADFLGAVQSLWLTHMLVMSDENYPGRRFLRPIDQYLYPSGSSRWPRRWIGVRQGDPQVLLDARQHRI